MALEWRNGVLEGTGWRCIVRKSNCEQPELAYGWEVTEKGFSVSSYYAKSRAEARTAALAYVRLRAETAKAQAERVICEINELEDAR